MIRRRKPVKSGDVFLEMKDGGQTEIRMVTEKCEFDDVADLIVIHPHAINAVKKDKWPRLDRERILKAANPSLRSKFNTWFGNIQQEALLRVAGGGNHVPSSHITLLETYESVVLHELTHTRLAHQSNDAPENKCYGWLNCIECRKPDNADSLALLTLAIQLIKHHGYDVGKNGNVKKF